MGWKWCPWNQTARKKADKIDALKDEMAQLSDEELKAKTPEFKERLKMGKPSMIF